ncbi:MAG: GGDEF domain-containing protein [Planctomycetes bacterium]|nr:GGDEF domain-containing protein [Planctomycetota bacterium]
MEPFGNGLPLLTAVQFQNALRIEFGRARRHGFQLSCALIGVDQLDQVRDVHGIDARDQVLARCVARLQAQIRASDLIAQFGDRLALLLPHANSDGARAVAERFRLSICQEPFRFEQESLKLTASAGIATLQSRATLFFDSLQKSAEAALKMALQAGGDRVEIASGIR